MAVKLDGKVLSKKIEGELLLRSQVIIDKTGVIPVLATILVGDDPSSTIYVNMKGRACKRVGIKSRKVLLPNDSTTDDVLNKIEELNNDDNVFGILLQHPVPKQIDERTCFDKIDLSKDVDGVTSLGFGKMTMGEDVFRCATPGGIMKMLEYYNVPLEGKDAVVVGRSPILGKPMAMMLLNKNATVTICHSRTKNLSDIIKRADIVVGAVGIKEFIKGDWIKKGAVLIDAGYHQGGFGDIEIDKAIDKCFAYTPVPGGVGPMTIATLISQTIKAAEMKLI